MVEDVLGIQPGRDPNRVVIIGGHIDSRVTDVMDATSDAPGANDDASGVALVLELGFVDQGTCGVGRISTCKQGVGDGSAGVIAKGWQASTVVSERAE